MWWDNGIYGQALGTLGDLEIELKQCSVILGSGVAHLITLCYLIIWPCIFCNVICCMYLVLGGVSSGNIPGIAVLALSMWERTFVVLGRWVGGWMDGGWPKVPQEMRGRNVFGSIVDNN